MRLNMIAVAAVLLVSALASVSPSEAASPTSRDPKAVAVFDQMVASYAKLNSLTETVIQSGPGEHRVTAEIALKRPGYASYRSDNKTQPYPPVAIVVDGTYFYDVTNMYPKQYLQFRLPAGRDAFTTAGSYAWGSEMDLAMFAATPNLLDFIHSLRKSAITLGKLTRDDGVTVDTVVLKQPDPQGFVSMTLHIGHEDHLLRRLAYQYREKGILKSGVEMHQDVKANPDISDAVFHFSPPPGRTAHHAFSYPMPEDPRAR